MMLLSRVTALFRAKSYSSTLAKVFAVMLVKTRMCPPKVESVPKVADLPTCQKTWQNVASPSRTTLLSDAVMRVDSIWEIKASFI
jgi:hypothetical protein